MPFPSSQSQPSADAHLLEHVRGNIGQRNRVVRISQICQGCKGSVARESSRGQEVIDNTGRRVSTEHTRKRAPVLEQLEQHPSVF